MLEARGSKGENEHVADESTTQDPLQEIARIDFLLDQLARAVESGEVPLASYESMAPRYLTRREVLVARLTAGSEPPAAAAGAAAGQPAHAARMHARPRRESKPVKWTTVLTFLGAFFVVVAAAIFAIAIWDVMGATGKLVFMGVLTAVFYLGGWQAHRLGLHTGATALTVVASAMLLFDGWIIIDGFELSGPLPWSVLLLVCSAVYWFTEVKLANRFFGVIGSAAQIGWWWLLGEGLALPVPTRLAGIAVIAVAWALTAERGREDPRVGSLARGLEWIAPVTQVAVAFGLLADLALVRSVDTTSLVAAAVVSACGGLTFWRSRLVAPPANHWAAAAFQLPLLAFAWAEWGVAGPSWYAVTVLALAAIAYDWLGITRAGTPFAVLGLVTEASLLFQLCSVLNADDRVVVLALATLAAMWAGTARLAAREDLAAAYPRLREVALVAEIGAIALLVGASLAVPVVSGHVALAGEALPRVDALLALGVLAAWYAAASVSRRGHFAFAGSVWAFYALAAMLSWALPDRTPDAYGCALSVLAGAWLLSAAALAATYGALWRLATRTASRFTMVAIPLTVISVSAAEATPLTYWMPALLAVTAAALALDAWISESHVSAAGAAAFAAATAAAAGGVTSRELGVEQAERVAAVSGAWGGLLAGLALSLPASVRRFAPEAAVAAAAAATGLSALAIESPAWLAVALVGSALAWAVASWRASAWFALPAGLSLHAALCAVLAHVGAPPAVTVAALGISGLAMGAPAFTRAGGPGGRRSTTGLALAAAGLLGLALIPVLGVIGDAFGSAGDWYRIGTSGIAWGLGLLGAGLIAQSARWHVEPGYYVGGFVLVLAVWTQLGTVDSAWVELYTTPLALYFVAAGYLRARLEPERGFPVIMDVAAVAAGLAYPLSAALSAPPSDALVHAAWVFGLSLVAIVSGVAVKSRWYFFGGVSAAALIALYRSFGVLAELWWLVLGVVGVAMLVVALTWERQRMVVTETKEALKRSFEGWR